MIDNYRSYLVEDYKSKNPDSFDEEKMSKDLDDVSNKNIKWLLIREFLVENLRGITWQSYDRSVDVLVSRLRSKLGETPNNTRFIKTIHGVGYKFIGKTQN